MKLSTLLFVTIMLLPSQAPLAKEPPFRIQNAAFLVESCKEAMDIFASQEETGYLAAYRTSLSEAMRAGYCIGVIEQYSHNYEPFCGGSSRWFEIAQRIASIELTQHELEQKKTGELLRENACDR